MYLSKDLKLLRKKLYHHHVTNSELECWPLPINKSIYSFGCLDKEGSHHVSLLLPRLSHVVGSRTLDFLGGGKGMWCEKLLPHHHFKWASGSRLASLQVIRELCHIKELCPIFFIGTHKIPKITLQQSIHPLSLAISLWVKASGKVKLDAQKLE